MTGSDNPVRKHGSPQSELTYRKAQFMWMREG